MDMVIGKDNLKRHVPSKHGKEMKSTEEEKN